MGYSFRLTARVLLYASSHRQDSTYHGLCYTSHGALAGTRNSSLGPPHEGSIRWPIAPSTNVLTTEIHLAPRRKSGCYIRKTSKRVCSTDVGRPLGPHGQRTVRGPRRNVILGSILATWELSTLSTTCYAPGMSEVMDTEHTPVSYKIQLTVTCLSAILTSLYTTMF